MSPAATRPIAGRVASPAAMGARMRAPRQVTHDLPTWPLTLTFVGVPLWWFSGVGELAFPLAAAVMLALMIRSGRIQAPRGFGLWLLFLTWMAFSVIGVDNSGRLVGFAYRALMYSAVTIFFLYVYNGRERLSARYIAGMFTAFWLAVIAGGYLGILAPLFAITTPLAYVLPDALLSNELVQEMVIRRATQFDPQSALVLDPRPSAPFLYTNGWGNAYSLLTPIVLAYLVMVRRERKFWWLVLAVPISLVPALLTLNRGMFLGLGIALAYVAVRLTMKGKVRSVTALLALVAVIALVYSALPVGERLDDRLEISSTTEDRAHLYAEAFERTAESPLFGYGSPRPSETAGAPSVGTQGHLWTVMFSHGFPGAALFMGWLVWLFVRTRRYTDAMGLACNTVMLVILVESTYYGVLTTGMPIAMVLAGFALRSTGPVIAGPSETFHRDTYRRTPYRIRGARQ